MSSPPIDELYFQWLYSQVGSVKLADPRRTHWNVLRVLYKKEFLWHIPNDDNRAEDGKALRYEFMDAEGLSDVSTHWIEQGCAVLELLIALARRLEFQTDEPVRNWFWTLMDHLGLEITDTTSEDRMDEILETFIWRTYHKDGNGGLFPLVNSQEDQRHVEIWYQMHAYLLERGYF